MRPNSFRLIADYVVLCHGRSALSEVKRFKIAGEIKKGKTQIPFTVEVSALKQEHALQRLYADMGSRHRARKFEITIDSVEQVNEEVKARNDDSTSK